MMREYTPGLTGMAVSGAGSLIAWLGTAQNALAFALGVVALFTGIILGIKAFFDMHRSWRKDRYCDQCPLRSDDSKT